MADGRATEASDGLVRRGVANAIAHPKVVYRLLLYVGLVVLVIPFLFPLYWLLLLAATPPGTAVGLVATDLTPMNFAFVLDPFGRAPLYIFVLNSVAIAVTTTAVVLVIGSLAGYVFGRLEFPGKWPLMLLTLSVAYFPPVSFFVPLFDLFTGNVELFGIAPPELFNTPAAIVLPLSALTMPLAIFILTVFYSQIPDTLEDAARVEGATRIGALYRVIIPMSGPGLATAGAVTFIQVYNEFLYSFLMTDGQAEHWATIVPMIRNMRAADPSFAAAASVTALLPVAVVILLANERIVDGLTASQTVTY